MSNDRLMIIIIVVVVIMEHGLSTDVTGWKRIAALFVSPLSILRARRL